MIYSYLQWKAPQRYQRHLLKDVETQCLFQTDQFLDFSDFSAIYWKRLKLNIYSKLSNSYILVVGWICQNWYVDFFKLLDGFVKIDSWISLSYDMLLSKMIHGFL